MPKAATGVGQQRVEILDAEGVEDGACECYATVNERYKELLGHLHEG